MQFVAWSDCQITGKAVDGVRLRMPLWIRPARPSVLLACLSPRPRGVRVFATRYLHAGFGSQAVSATEEEGGFRSPPRAFGDACETRRVRS